MKSGPSRSRRFVLGDQFLRLSWRLVVRIDDGAREVTAPIGLRGAGAGSADGNVRKPGCTSDFLTKFDLLGVKSARSINRFRIPHGRQVYPIEAT
jgi:hypothetical protein